MTEQLTHTSAKVGRWGKQSSLGVSDSLGIPAFSWPEGPRASLHPVGFSGLCQAPKAPLGRQGSRHSSENPTLNPPLGHFLAVLPLGWCPLLSGHCLPLEEEDKVMPSPQGRGDRTRPCRQLLRHGECPVTQHHVDFPSHSVQEAEGRVRTPCSLPLTRRVQSPDLQALISPAVKRQDRITGALPWHRTRTGNAHFTPCPMKPSSLPPEGMR